MTRTYKYRAFYKDKTGSTMVYGEYEDTTYLGISGLVRFLFDRKVFGGTLEWAKVGKREIYRREVLP